MPGSAQRMAGSFIGFISKRDQGIYSGGLYMGPWQLNMFLAKVDPNVGGGCPFCDLPETVEHLFAHCNHVTSLLNIFNMLCVKVRMVFSLRPTYSLRSKA